MWQVWREQVGAYDFGRFRREMGPLWQDGPPADPAVVVTALKRAIVWEKGRDALHFFTPKRFAEHWSVWRERAEWSMDDWASRLPQPKGAGRGVA